MSDKLLKVGKVAKALEASPRLMHALKIGSAAVRAGIVQGAQTTIRTGGDAGQGVKEGAGMAATSGVLGGLTGAASGVLGKGANAARTVQTMGDIAESAPTSVDVGNQLSSAVSDAFSDTREAANQQLSSATGNITDFASGAPENSAITQNAQAMTRTANKIMHDKYAQGVQELSSMTDGQTIPFVGSPLHQAALDLAERGASDGKPLDSAFDQTRPGSAGANRMVDALTNVGSDGSDVSLDTNELIQRRQQLGERMRNLGWSTSEDRADRATYGKLIGGIDDTIGKLADQTGNPDATGKLIQMNSEYRLSSKLFANRDVMAVLKGNTNDVAKRLMSGQTSLDDIAAVRQTLGDRNFAQLGSDSLKRLTADSIDADGNLDLPGLVKRWGRIKPEVRTAMFGGTGAASLSTALDQATDATGQLADVNDSVSKLLGNGDVSALLKSPARVSALTDALGPDGMKSLGQTMLQSKIGEASTALDPKTGQMVKSAFDPDKVLSWYKTFANAPEIRDAVFTTDPQSKAAYGAMMSKLSEASSVKKLVKFGILPATLGTVGLSHGAVPALLAALAGLGAEGFGSARSILDSIANHPATWATLRNAGDVVNSPAATGLGKLSRYGVFARLKGSLSGHSDQPDDANQDEQPPQDQQQ